MTRIQFDQQIIELEPDESVLDALLRSDVDIPFSCRAGSCQSCMMRAVQGTPPRMSQLGLRESLVALGYFLPCVGHPEEDLQVAFPDEETTAVKARISFIEHLTDNIARILLETDKPFPFRAGQFLNLVRDDGLVRSYSIANLPNDSNVIELHVRRVPNGRMSCWLYERETFGQRVLVRGPSGDCFYMPDDPEQDILMVGTGTGLAPLYGILRDAFAHNHKGRIRLYHGTWDPGGLYLVRELKALAKKHENFEYFPVILEEDEAKSYMLVGRIEDLVADRETDLKGWRVYLCGKPDMVHLLRKKAFLAGAHSKQIHADAFITASGN